MDHVLSQHPLHYSAVIYAAQYLFLLAMFPSLLLQTKADLPCNVWP
jgi:hypothetical protein